MVDTNPGEKITQQIYEKFDRDKNGYVSREEFTLLLQALDHKFFTTKMIDTLFKAADQDDNGAIDYSEFFAWITSESGEAHRRIIHGGAPGMSMEDADKILRCCEEADKDNSGSISKTELAEVLKKVTNFRIEEVDNLMEAVDLNKDGDIPYLEFLKWMCLPPNEKHAFADNVRQWLELDGRLGEPSSHTRSSTITGEEASEQSQFAVFVHPLLDRCSVVDDFASSFTGSRENTVIAVMQDEASFRGSQSGVYTDYRGGLKLDVDKPSLGGHDAFGLAKTGRMLENLAEAYGKMFAGFATWTDKASRDVTLRFPPIPILDRRSNEIMQEPELAWSAIALALATLPLPLQDLLEKAKLELCERGRSSTGTAAEHEATLDNKKKLAKTPVDADGCRLPEQEGSRSWIRKDNGPVARFQRVQAFLLTLRSVRIGAYKSNDVHVMLTQVDNMVKGTKIQTIDKFRDPGRASGATRLLGPNEVGCCASATVMEVSQKMAQEDSRNKVVAVNAASAYHCGGGVSTGGRHALEEAWCMISTLFRSLLTVEPEPLAGYHGGDPEYHQHIPTRGVVISPDVEIFREGSNEGYEFLETPVTLGGVVSVAMFNRNSGVRDSPLDSPDDKEEYMRQTMDKIASTVLAAIELSANILVIPDVGCGVFQNDARLVGGCLGLALRKYNGHVEKVIVTSSKPEFFDACKLAFEGQDPRGDGRSNLGEKEIEECLIAIARIEFKPKQWPCKYGYGCRIKDRPDHAAKYWHPDPPTSFGPPSTVSRWGGSSSPSRGGRSRFDGRSTDFSGGSGFRGGSSGVSAGVGGIGRDFSGGSGGSSSTRDRGGSSGISAGVSGIGRDHFSGGAGGSSSTRDRGGSSGFSAGVGGIGRDFSGGARGSSSTRDSGGPTHESGSGVGAGASGGGSSGVSAGVGGIGRDFSGGARGSSSTRDSGGPTHESSSGVGAGASGGGREADAAGRSTGGGHDVDDAGRSGGGGADLGRVASSGAAGPSTGTKVYPRGKCKYWDKCWTKTAQHLADYEHPPMSESNLENVAHAMISAAKNGLWTDVITMLREKPEVVNIRPLSRTFGVIHFACYKLEHEVIRTLVDDYGADITLPAGDGQYCDQLFALAMKHMESKTPEGSPDWYKDRNTLRWIQKQLKRDDLDGRSISSGSALGRDQSSPVASQPSTQPRITDARDGGYVKPGGKTLGIHCTRPFDLKGEYVELTIRFYNCAVYRKDGNPGMSKKAAFLYHSKDPVRGWVVDEDGTDSNDQHLAYLGTHAGREPWYNVQGETWYSRWNGRDNWQPHYLMRVTDITRAPR